MRIPDYIPTLAEEDTAELERGKNDKVEINVGQWLVCCGDDGDAINFLHHLGPPPRLHRRTRVRQSQGDTFGFLFNSFGRDELPWRFDIAIRSAPMEIEGEAEPTMAPLISGHANWSLHRIPGPLPVLLRVELRLSINPTRFVRYRVRSSSALRQILSPVEAIVPPYGEFALDGQDNWLPLAGRFWAAFNAHSWMDHVRRYIQTVEAVFHTELSRVGEQHSVPVVRESNSYNVRMVETYWEWLSDNPLAFVESIFPRFRSFSRSRAGLRIYETTNIETDRNMLLLYTDNVRGERLKVYSKTNRRVRMEVQHRFTGNERFQFNNQSTAHTFDNLAAVINFLQRVRVQARKTTNRFLSHLGKRRRAIRTHITGYQAIFHVVSTLPEDHETALEIIKLMTQNGFLDISGLSAPIKAAIPRLRKLGLLSRDQATGRYFPSGGYAPAFESLRRNGGLNKILRVANGPS